MRYYSPRGTERKVERHAERAGVVVIHRHGRKIIETHSLDETCTECEHLQAQGR